MIAFDSSEQNGLSAPTIKTLAATSLPWLEEVTGADCLVSSFPAPLLPATLPLHLDNRAVLIQIKHGEDLLDSAGYRLNESLARMIEVTRAPWQRVLVPVGLYTQGKEGAVLVGMEKPTSDPNKPFVVWWVAARSSWAAYETSLRRWVLRGGTVLSCGSGERLAASLRAIETDLRILDPVKEFYQPGDSLQEVDKDSPVQELRPVKDWRRLLAALPGIGPTKINALVETFGEHKLPLSGAIAIEWALESPLLPHIDVPGWGNKTRENLRKFMGFVDDSQILNLMYLPQDYVVIANQSIREAEAEFGAPVDMDSLG